MGTCSKRPAWAIIIITLVGGVAACGQTTTAPSAGQPPATAAALNPEVDRILTQLEQRRVHDLHARLAWRQEYVYDLEEDWVTKKGEIWYQEADPVAKFLIHFTEKIAGTRKDRLNEKHLFDGCWYTELQSRTKTVQRREIRKPDDPTDPYKVGQGAFPLPFGQKKDDILREFSVELLSPQPDDPPDTDHLRLLPRTGTKTGESYKELHFWIDRKGPTAGLPIKVRVAKIDGTGKVNSHITITFSDAELNRGFSSSIFEIKVPPDYTLTEEPLEPIPPPPGQTPQPSGRGPADLQGGVRGRWMTAGQGEW